MDSGTVVHPVNTDPTRTRCSRNGFAETMVCTESGIDPGYVRTLFVGDVPRTGAVHVHVHGNRVRRVGINRPPRYRDRSVYRTDRLQASKRHLSSIDSVGYRDDSTPKLDIASRSDVQTKGTDFLSPTSNLQGRAKAMLGTSAWPERCDVGACDIRYDCRPNVACFQADRNWC